MMRDNCKALDLHYIWTWKIDIFSISLFFSFTLLRLIHLCVQYHKRSAGPNTWFSQGLFGLKLNCSVGTPLPLIQCHLQIC